LIDGQVPKGSTVELSADGFAFIAALFEKYDEDRDGCLSAGELTNLFSVCPVNPFGGLGEWFTRCTGSP